MKEDILKASFSTLKKVKLGNFKVIEEELELLGIEYTEEDLLEAFAIATESSSIDEALGASKNTTVDVLENAKKKIQLEKEDKANKEKAEAEKKAKEKLIEKQAKDSNYLNSISLYQICSGKSDRELENNVFREMQKGWIPYGGVSTYNPGGKLGGVPDSFFQAMVKLKQ